MAPSEMNHHHSNENTVQYSEIHAYNDHTNAAGLQNETRQNAGEESDDAGQSSRPSTYDRHVDDDDRSEIIDNEVDYWDGDEALRRDQTGNASNEGDSVWIPGVGMLRFRAIFTGLAQHSWCTCHSHPLRDIIDGQSVTNGNTPTNSGLQTPSSTVVEPGSGEQSLAASMYLGTASPFAFQAFTENSYSEPTPANHFTSAPIWLTGPIMNASPYPMQLGPIEESPSDEES